VRLTDFLRTAVLLFAAAATVLAVVAVAGAGARGDLALVWIGAGWWAIAAAVGLWLGRRTEPSAGLSRLMAGARTTSSLPDVEPARVILSRLWTLALVTVAAGAIAFLVPQVPAVGAGYALIVALAWRKHEAAVRAIEDRDGVRYYLDRSGPLEPTKLVRTPGLRKIAPVDDPSLVRRKGAAVEGG
jgi:hypothetical protein